MSDFLLPENFSGTVRLFPLGDLVLFPHVVQPLRIFEPRYIEMMEEAVAGDQLIAMAVLQPGWEADYEGDPPIHPTVCIGRILSHSLQSDGCYHLLLAGVARANIVREHDRQRQFRIADVDLVNECGLTTISTEKEEMLRTALLEAFRRLDQPTLADEEIVKRLLDDEVPLSVLTDVIAFAVPFTVHEKQTLLDTASVAERAYWLIDRLESLSRPDAMRSNFPPDFSDN